LFDKILDDIDLIYFDEYNCREKIDQEKEKHLTQVSDYPWSVKNQTLLKIECKKKRLEKWPNLAVNS